MAAKKLLVTGVYGLIAGAIYSRFQSAPDKYDVYALARRRYPSDRAPDGRTLDIPDDRFFLADLSDISALRKAVEGMDVVVQMAADPRPEAEWGQILNSNMIGAYNVFETSRDAGVGRIVFASSVMASWGYQFVEPYKAIKECRHEDVPESFPLITHKDPPRPTEPYSASKVWGEALARTYSDVHGMSCICLRIGWVNAEDDPYLPAVAPVWCSQRDIVQLVERCVDAPDDLRFDIFYGVSNNKYRWVDTQHAKNVVGFDPED